MKMIAVQTVKAGGIYRPPGDEFDIADPRQAKALVTAGAAREKGKTDEPGTEPGDDLDAKTKAELEALAKERGVDIAGAKSKTDIVEALRAA